ncbi:MAG: DMT family transporter [Devosiaceae bacterium]|nr:DMT family transporter [Devosiaceae bacterium]
MPKILDLSLAAAAPIIWGSTYIVTTQMLPAGYPLTDALLRALPAGFLLLAITRKLPSRQWVPKLMILGALNFSIFWALLFVAAYRLPGGLAATFGAIQPLIVVLLANVVLNTPLAGRAIIAALAGLAGVALLLLGPGAGELDGIGVAAALGGALSMAIGVVLTRRWKPPVSALTFTAWQLIAGGLLLLPVALIIEPPLPDLSYLNIAGFLWLGLFGAAMSYFFWFRAIERLGPVAVTNFTFLSPLSAVLLGWFILGEILTPVQIFGVLIVLGSIWLGGSTGRFSFNIFQNKE